MSFQPEKPAFCLNLIQNCSAGSQGLGSFVLLCHCSCVTLGSEIKLILFGSGSREKCPCFGTEIHSFFWMLSSFSTCFLSVIPLPVFCTAFWVTGVCLSLCKCSIARRDGSRLSLESVLFPPICNESTALWCYQIILFQKLLIKTWVIRQVTKDFLFIFLNNTK